MTNDPKDTTDNSLEWFAENLPPEYLNHPEYFLYSTALGVQKMQDIPENRKRFKQLLIERQMSEGIELPAIDQKQLHDFMNPNDRELKLRRSEELLELTTKHLEQTQDFAQAQRLAVLELFHREAPFRQAEMDERYFRNRELVEADLRTYLEHAKGDSLKDLHTNNPKESVSIQTQSDEQVTWNTYLSRASGVLFGTKRKTVNPHRRPDTLKALLRIAGLEIPKYIRMDEKYFNNPEYVKADLTVYLQKAEGDSLKELNTNNPGYDTSILTQSGELTRWDTYLSRASGFLLGTKQSTPRKKSNNPHRPSDALKALFKIVGVEVPEYIPMDKKYFNDPEIVKADLTAYLQQAEGKSIKELHTENPEPSIAIKTQSGELVAWRTYLSRASGALLRTKQRTDNPHRPTDALKALLKIAGIDITEYIPMDESYFNNPEIVNADINSYLQHAEGNMLKDLNTKNPKRSVSIKTQSGELVAWRAYLDRASSVLLGTKASQIGKKCDNPHRSANALKKLIQIAEQTGACNDQSPMTPAKRDPTGNDQLKLKTRRSKF